MKTLRCIAVDDEPNASEIVKKFAEKTPFLEFLGSFHNPLEALQKIQEGGIDLVFLDIQMPELSGIEFLNIASKQAKFIICTAYPKYALEGYEHNVVDYLLKPFPFDRFYKACQKALTQGTQLSLFQNPTLSTPKPESKTENSTAHPQEFMFVKSELKIQKVYLSEILFIEGLKDYVSIYTKKDRIITLQTMKKMEETLVQPRFVRVHRSYLVAIDKIESIERNRIFMGDKIIPIGDTYKEEFFTLIEAKNI